VGSGNCADTQIQNTSVAPDVNPAFNQTNVCTSDGLLDLNSLLTGSAGGTWSGTGVAANQFNPVGLSGAVAITYTVGIGSCTETATQNLNVVSASDASFALPANICEGAQIIDLNNYATGTPNGTWSGTGVSNNLFDATGLSGPISITCTAGTGSCTDVQTNIINVQTIPASPQVNDTSYCNNQTAPLVSAVALNGATISWYGAGAANVELAQGPTYQIPQNSEGQYWVTQTINGCTSATAVMEVVINQAPLVPVLSGNGLLCNSTLMQNITANTSGTISWYVNNTQSNPIFTGSVLAAGTSLNANNALLVQAYENGCFSAVSDFPLNDPGILTANILGDDELVVCFNQQNATLSSDDIDLNSWSNGSVSQQIEINEAGIYYLNRSNACGTASDTIRVIDGSADASFFIDIPSNAFVPSFVIPTALSAGGQTCSWLQNEVPIEFGLSGVLIDEESDQIFTHICVSELGCADTVTKTVKLPLPAELFVPNSFTPNGDGNNDNWQPVGSRIKDLNIEIFNRWGELVSQVISPLGFWDGNSKNGQPAPEGVYTFKLRARDLNLKDYEFFGAIYLIR
jgi:gliding motility-associated-like protein